MHILCFDFVGKMQIKSLWSCMYLFIYLYVSLMLLLMFFLPEDIGWDLEKTSALDWGTVIIKSYQECVVAFYTQHTEKEI